MNDLTLPILLSLLLLLISAVLYLIAWRISGLAHRHGDRFDILIARLHGVVNGARLLVLMATAGLVSMALFSKLIHSNNVNEEQFAWQIAPWISLTLTFAFALMLFVWVFFFILLARGLRESDNPLDLLWRKLR